MAPWSQLQRPASGRTAAFGLRVTEEPPVKLRPRIVTVSPRTPCRGEIPKATVATTSAPPSTAATSFIQRGAAEFSITSPTSVAVRTRSGLK